MASACGPCSTPSIRRTSWPRPIILPLLYVAGTVEPGDARAVAITGTRRPTPRALARAHRAAAALTDAGITVVSGLAAGIDTAAHSATLDAGGRTIGVIATGLRHGYPADNADLQARIAREGAVITQFAPNTRPTRRNFAIRNAVTAGIALATLLVEATRDSGSLITARHALRYGRPVYLPASLLEHDWACELAGQPGVRVIDDPQQIAADFPSPAPKATTSGATAYARAPDAREPRVAMSPEKSPENQTGDSAPPGTAGSRGLDGLTFGLPDRRSNY